MSRTEYFFKSPYILWAVMLVAFTSCERQPTITPVYPPIINPKGGLFILNEGNYQFANATLDYYDFETQKMSENAFEGKNNRKLGDVLQSMTRYGNEGYLVVNNSQKIEVIDMLTLASLGTITGFKSPRYMVVQNPQKAYVSEYFNGGIKIVDIATRTIIGSIPLQGNCEEILLNDNKLYVTVANSRYIYVINTVSDVVMDSILVSYGPNSMKKDHAGNLWVLCAGRNQPPLVEEGSLVKIDPFADSVLVKYHLTRQSEHGPIKLRINTQKNTLYWINRNIYRHQTQSTTGPGAPWITAIKNNYWGLNYDSLTDEIYVADAVDYIQRSIVSRYDETATLRGTFRAGLITGDFFFYYRQ